jgi:GT2 family glycosyltransferase
VNSTTATATDKAPRVVVIVLNWNGREDTLGCLKSLQDQDYLNWEPLVVDNGSEDGSVDAIHKAFPKVQVIEAGRNLGFTGGNNLGITAALERGAEFILMLNNDTTVARDLLTSFVGAAKEHPDAGVFGAKIYFLGDPQRLSYAGTRWNATGWDFDHIGKGMLDNGVDFEQVQDTEYAHGCAMFFRASAARAVGLLDDRFFIMYEEVDWCFRAKKAGFRCLFVPQAKVWHQVSATFTGQRSMLYEYFIMRNRLLWAERHLPLRRRMAVLSHTLEIVWPIWGVVGVLGQVLRARRGVKQGFWEARQIAVGWWDGLGEPSLRMVRKAQRRALRDYLVRRFGDCPASLRAAAARRAPTGG